MLIRLMRKAGGRAATNPTINDIPRIKIRVDGATWNTGRNDFS